MSFMDNIGKLEGLLGGANPTDAAAAASDHVASMNPGDLSNHLQQSLGGMDTSSLMSLGSHLLQQFEQQGQGAGQAAQDAGTDTAAVQSGDPNAISSLIQQAESNPQVLQSAASNFFGSNPGVIGQLAPAFSAASSAS